MTLASGARLGPYEVIALLGKGGMGEVYRARDTRLARTVAVKVLSAGIAGDPESRARLDREARAIASLNHPNICALHDVGREAGIDFLVMELLEGETLEHRLARGALDVGVVVDAGIALADALDAAHARDLIHRDLKPANIFITTRGQVKILDFGLAKAVERVDATTGRAEAFMSEAGAIAGTVVYMSPEQLRGQTLDVRTDLFSLGLVIYEMATGRHAFTGNTTAVVAAAILGQDPIAPRALRPDLPPRLEDAILKALEKDRDLRCQTASELRADLGRIKRELSSTAVASVAPPGALASTTRTVRRRGVQLAAASALIAATVFGTWWMLRNREPAQEAIAAAHHQVTFAGNVLSAAMSPDGRSVAYVTDERPTSRLIVQDVAGGPGLELARGKALKAPTWSPDGSVIAYSATLDDQTRSEHPFTVPRMGGPSRQLSGAAYYMAWSPDGTQLALGSQRIAGGFDIERLEDGARRQVALPSFRLLRGLDWDVRTNRIAVLEQDDHGRWVVWIVTPDGKDARAVYTDSGSLTAIRWSPVADVIYGLRGRSEAIDLVALDVSNPQKVGARVLVTGLPAGDSLSIARDARSLVHVRAQTSSNLAMFDMERPSDPPHPLTSGTRSYTTPRISPDGRWVTAALSEAPWTHIVILPVGGGDARVLTSGEALDKSPSWSPDGTQIAFASNRGGTRGIWVMNVEGQALRRLDVDSLGSNLLASWMPDGSLGWQQTAVDGSMNWRVRDFKSGEERLLAGDLAKGYFFDPRFSPNGSEVAVYWNRASKEGARGLYVFTWPGRVPRLLKEQLVPMGWSHEGDQIFAYSSLDRPEIFAVSARTGEARLLVTIGDGSFNVSGVGDVSADGRHLVVSIQDRKADAWRIEHFDPRVR